MNMKSLSMLAMVFFMCIFSVCFAAGKEPPGPEDAYIDGSDHAYYGKDQGGWRDTRREFDHDLYGKDFAEYIVGWLDICQ